MNILPKKRWHVRTKDNIARVRKDEAEAAEKERQEKLRTENADREARLNVLKQKSKQKLLEFGVTETENGQKSTQEHINLFADIDHTAKSSNKEHDKEVKEKTEEYEKKIGYLTYLGQDTNESLKKKNWYEVLPEASRFTRSSEIKDTYEKLVLKDEDGKPKIKENDCKNGEVSWKAKQRDDPINAFRKYGLEKVKKPNMKNDDTTQKNDKQKSTNEKKRQKDKDSKLDKLQKLRESRLKREQSEKLRAELFLTGLHEPSVRREETIPKVKAKYNSQFNPELARQNYK